ncbi:hypothetical protein DWUX_312 [Desulfovibrio diazotrophicus]|nr:hypothetical protein DWUX_312 [Desulfovibrio diazotrophicus]
MAAPRRRATRLSCADLTALGRFVCKERARKEKKRNAPALAAAGAIAAGKN